MNTPMMSIKEAHAYSEGYRAGVRYAFEIAIGVAAGLQTEYGENVVQALHEAERAELHE